MQVKIRPIDDTDYQAIVSIYNHYITHSIATFELETIDTGSIANRVEHILGCGLPWLVAEDENANVLGYAYASQWKERLAYKNSVEVTVYLHPELKAKGVGSQLYQVLFARLKQAGVHAVMAGISLPNPASVALHEKFAMQKVAHFAEVGRKFGQWIDVGYWQLLLADKPSEKG